MTDPLPELTATEQRIHKLLEAREEACALKPALRAAEALCRRYTIGDENCIEPFFVPATPEQVAAIIREAYR
jgi:hypothetical protein